MNLPIVSSRERQNRSDRDHPCDRSENVVEIYPVNLSEYLGNQTCSALGDVSVGVLLQMENPLGSNDVDSLGLRSGLPYVPLD